MSEIYNSFFTCRLKIFLRASILCFRTVVKTALIFCGGNRVLHEVAFGYYLEARFVIGPEYFGSPAETNPGVSTGLQII